ncbi:MAG TPA: hypothetical protein VF727_10855 [Allosphingosinicella sp.]|jgi:hypothetical protein
MGSVSRLALGLMLGLGAVSVLGVSPAVAKKKNAAPAGPSLSKEERAALAALQAAINSRNYAAAGPALSAAQAAARSKEARYYTNILQLRLARESGNLAAEAAAIDALLASGSVPQAEIGNYYAAQGTLALRNGNRERAEASLTRAVELAPSTDTLLTLAQMKIDTRRSGQALPLVERAIELRRASGQPVPESWYRRALSLATQNAAGPQALRLNREWIAAYPSATNWRDALLVYRDYAQPDPAALVDTFRLMRLSHALAGERDYMEAAQAFTGAKLPGESRSVFEEGVSGRVVDPAKGTFKEAIAASTRAATAARGKLAALRTAATGAATGGPALDAGDQFLSFGDYAAAVDLYQAALQKGGADASAVNTRLGIALALAGRRAEAETAFRAVSGPRAELAQLWLVWLGQRA